MRNIKKEPLLLNPAKPRRALPEKPKTKSLKFPGLSKSSLHNYFAEKMAVFSNILGLVHDQTEHVLPEQVRTVSSFKSLYHKLVAIRAAFLDKYHDLLTRSGKGLSAPEEKIVFIYDHINEFEQEVVSEIVTAGIKKEELPTSNNPHHLELTERSQT